MEEIYYKVPRIVLSSTIQQEFNNTYHKLTESEKLESGMKLSSETQLTFDRIFYKLTEEEIMDFSWRLFMEKIPIIDKEKREIYNWQIIEDVNTWKYR